MTKGIFKGEGQYEDQWDAFDDGWTQAHDVFQDSIETMQNALRLIASAETDEPPISTGDPKDTVSCMALIARTALCPENVSQKESQNPERQSEQPAKQDSA